VEGVLSKKKKKACGGSSFFILSLLGFGHGYMNREFLAKKKKKACEGSSFFILSLLGFGLKTNQDSRALLGVVNGWV
jgi:hypothetical protein